MVGDVALYTSVPDEELRYYIPLDGRLLGAETYSALRAVLIARGLITTRLAHHRSAGKCFRVPIKKGYAIRYL